MIIVSHDLVCALQESSKLLTYVDKRVIGHNQVYDKQLKNITAVNIFHSQSSAAVCFG